MYSVQYVHDNKTMSFFHFYPFLDCLCVCVCVCVCVCGRLPQFLYFQAISLYGIPPTNTPTLKLKPQWNLSLFSITILYATFCLISCPSVLSLCPPPPSLPPAPIPQPAEHQPVSELHPPSISPPPSSTSDVVVTSPRRRVGEWVGRSVDVPVVIVDGPEEEDIQGEDQEVMGAFSGDSYNYVYKYLQWYV